MDQSVPPSVPEPPPKPSGIIVPEALITVIQDTKDHLFSEAGQGLEPFRDQAASNLDSLIALVKARDAFGQAKYGQRLMSDDGRNGIEDARQELGDLLQYVMKCKLAGQDLTEFMELVTTACLIMRVIEKK